MATSLYKGQIPFRAKGQSTCLHHKGGQLDLYCKTCEELACIKCLSTVHNSHPLCALSEVTWQQKRDIHNFIDKTERVDLVQVDKYITSTEKHLKDNSRNFENLSQKLKTQTNKLKQDLDLLTAQTLSLYQQMEEENTKLLQTYKQDLEMYSAQLKQQVQDCKIALQRGSDIQIYDTGHAIQLPVTLPEKPTLGIVGFTPNKNPLVNLEKALGEVNTSGQIRGQPLQGHDRSVSSSETRQRSKIKGRIPSFTPSENPLVQLEKALGEVNTSVKIQGQPSQGHDRSVWSSAGQRQSGSRQRSETKGRTPSTQQISTGRKTMTSPVYTLLSQTKVFGEWKSPFDISSVCPTTDSQMWTSDYDSNTLTLLDRKGKVIQEAKHNADITDISQSPTTNTLWVCDEKNNITELVLGRLVHRFSTRHTPLCICITASNNVIVGLDNNISKYTTKGNLVLTTSATGTRKPLVCDSYRMAECPVTHNVAVADSDSSHLGGEWKPRVVIMDTDFKELFVYDGDIPSTYQLTSQSGDELFKPHGVVYDSVGNLVIGDGHSNRILLISGRGEFIRVIHTDDQWPSAVGIDREGILWAVFRAVNVKLLQYRRLDKLQPVYIVTMTTYTDRITEVIRITLTEYKLPT